jgi:16S rRNA (adenine1518-N6/adenine1519-N6)-dimethyltransferase
MPYKLSRHRKRLGQVFLRDPLVIEQILHSAAIAPHETVLEIGPGPGALTGALAQYASELYAIEIDAQYVHRLQQRFTAAPHVHIIHADARQYDYELLPRPLVMVANLPYSMGTAILTHVLSFRQRLSRLIVMLQHEVAVRLIAAPGTSAYGALSVFFQYYTALQHCFEVSRHAFHPIPAVDSTVVQLVPWTTSPYPGTDERFFFRVVQAAFAYRRKVLRSNLLALSDLPLTQASLTATLADLGLSNNVRAQELSLSQFVQLAAALRHACSS